MQNPDADLNSVNSIGSKTMVVNSSDANFEDANFGDMIAKVRPSWLAKNIATLFPASEQQKQIAEPNSRNE